MSCSDYNYDFAPWVVVALLILHGLALRFLEGYLWILPPPPPPPPPRTKQHLCQSSKNHGKRRPAVYLVKLVTCVGATVLLWPLAVGTFIPNLLNVLSEFARHSVSFSVSDGDGDNQLRNLSFVQPLAGEEERVCMLDAMGALLHMTNFAFEMLMFDMAQSNTLLLHHFASLFYCGWKLSFRHLATEWFFCGLGFHVLVYSMNLIRPIYTFSKHFLVQKKKNKLTSDAAEHGAQQDHQLNRPSPLFRLFLRVDAIAWMLIILGYVVSSLGAFYEFGILEASFCLAAAVPLFFGAALQLWKYRHEIMMTPPTTGSSNNDTNDAKLLIQIGRELVIGVFVVPALLTLNMVGPSRVKRFFSKTSHKNTAGGVAGLRFLCSMESADERIHLEDPYAERYISNKILRFVGSSTVLRYLLFRALEKRHPGALGHLISRTRSIDDCILDLTSPERSHPVTQIVLLGAGYDMRAYRLSALGDRGVTVFEVDQSFMSKEKQQKCYGLQPTCNKLVHIETDFNNDSLAEMLIRCNQFDATQSTLYIWEGVSVYLPEESVDDFFRNLRQVVAVSSSGGEGSSSRSYLYFTFADKRILDSASRDQVYGGNEFVRYAAGIGEQARSGVDISQVDEYLQGRGLVPYEYEGASGLTGYITPEQKQAHYFSQHPFIPQSEVFHNCLACISAK